MYVEYRRHDVHDSLLYSYDLAEYTEYELSNCYFDKWKWGCVEHESCELDSRFNKGGFECEG
jgi:hypothetical protein